jgi:methylsterol monooxygenase
MTTRTTAFNVAAAIAVWGCLITAFLFQGHVRVAFAPIFEAVEASRIAYVLCFMGFLAMPEPSPAVIVISAFAVFTPPRSAWAWFMSSFDEDYKKVVVMMTAIFAGVYWINGFLLLALENFCAKRLDRYRIQKQLKAHSRPSMAKLIKNVLRSTCLVPVIGFVMGKNMNFKPHDYEVPGPFEMFLSTLMAAVANEITFFYGHWLFHANKFLYGRIHKVHHEFKAPCALAAVYCHPVELVVSDFLPLAAGIIMFNNNLYFAATFTAFAVLGTQTHHCGFRWPWIPSHGNQPDFHDYHHEKFNCNYGNMGFLDALHGTVAVPASLKGHQSKVSAAVNLSKDSKINGKETIVTASQNAHAEQFPRNPQEAASADIKERSQTLAKNAKNRSSTPRANVVSVKAA